MHELALGRAALPAPIVCLGMLLRPYSIGHELWLIRESNSVLRGAIYGLPAAVILCAQTWDELKTMRADRLLPLKLWLWRRRIRNLDRGAALLKFITYRNDGLLEFPLSEIPKADDGGGPARVHGTPFILRLQQWLMQEFRFSESAAWDYPVGLAKMRWATHWEAQGGLEIYNAHEAEFDRFVAQERAKKKEVKCLA